MQRTHPVRYGLLLLGLGLALFNDQASSAQPVEPPGNTPQILSLDFPQVIPPDGTPVAGTLTFADPDGDVVALELSVVRAFDFGPSTVTLGAAENAAGAVEFSLSSPSVQPVALAARLIDAAGHRSLSVVFYFAAVSDEREVAKGVYFINAWGEKGSGPGQFAFEGPQGVRVGPDHNVYVIDEGNHRTQVFTPQGDYVREWGGFGSADQPGRFNFPSDLVFSPEGNIYVSDSLNDRIQVFDPGLNFLFAFGTTGFGRGQLNAPRGLAFDAAGELYVADELNGRVQVFDGQGNFLRQWGQAGSDDPGRFNVIVGLDVDEANDVYVADGFNHRVQVFDEQGNFLRQWGSFGRGEGQFNDPVGVAVSPGGWVAVTDSFNDRVQLWTQDGRFLRVWGAQSDAPGEGFKLPLGADSDGLGMLYIGDHFNRRTQAFYVAIDPQEIEGTGTN